MTHIPVLLNEALNALRVQPAGCYVDCTFGRGGHSRAILQQLGPEGRLIGLDRDPEAVAEGQSLSKQDGRFHMVHTAFSDLAATLGSLSISRVDGILMDLGVSSPQLDEPSRGFSFQSDGPLDMRMDPTQGVPAAQWLATASAEAIAEVLWIYGEERFSRRIARAIVEARAEEPIQTTAHLARIIANAQPKKDAHKHPATRAFQGIRLFINAELSEVEQGLEDAIEALVHEGRLAVISFHSLEDRLVKRTFRDASRPPQGDPRMPLPVTAARPRLRLVGKATKPSDAEIQRNPRSRSAVLRIAERTEAA